MLEYVIVGSPITPTAFSPNTTYRFAHEVTDVNPGTGVAWTGSDLNALEAGIKLVSVT